MFFFLLLDNLVCFDNIVFGFSHIIEDIIDHLSLFLYKRKNFFNKPKIFSNSTFQGFDSFIFVHDIIVGINPFF